MPDIALSNVSKSYDSSTIKAVSNLNLTIGDGEFMCLLGPSGCGKTTTLRMIAGLENLTEGEISVGGRTIDAAHKGIFVPPEKRGMGLVFQSYALWPHLTVERNTDFGLRLRNIPKKEREERVTDVMKTLGIEEYRDRLPSQLSGGQQQRVALARMLAVNPEVLLLDEPLSNLDARLRLEMRAELKRIHKEFGTTIVFVTHDQWEAMTLATSIAVMHEGALQQLGSPSDIYDRPANRFVAEFVGGPPINITEMGERGETALAVRLNAFIASALNLHGAAASIGLRPENIKIAETAGQIPAENFQITGHVEAILPTGGSWIVEVTLEGEKLFITTGEAPAFEVGDDLLLHASPTHFHVFDNNQNRMINDATSGQQSQGSMSSGQKKASRN